MKIKGVRLCSGFVIGVVLFAGVHRAWAESGITNIISGVSSNVSSTYMVGTNGAFNVLIVTNAGALLVFGDSVVGNSTISSNNNAWVSGGGSVWSNSGGLYIGATGSFNSLFIANNANVFSSTGYVGSSSLSSNNSVMVTGASSIWNLSTNWPAGILDIGVSSSGNRLIITNGGHVVGVMSQIGLFNGANNRVVVTGSGSVWTNKGALNIGGVGGSGGNNGLFIENGGSVFDANCLIAVSPLGSTNNSVVVSGSGSVWTNTGLVSIGNEGSWNWLIITNGGKAYDAKGVVGVNATASNNSVLVAGSGSLWNNSSSLTIGNAGSRNSLTITNGGQVFAVSGFIGYYASASNNAVLVTGGGSVWNNSGYLYVGSNGSFNQLTIANGGAVFATNVVIGYGDSAGNVISVSGGNLNATNAAISGALDVRFGTLALNSGTVTVDRLYATNGAASVVNFNSGLLRSGGSSVSNGMAFTVGDSTSAATLDLVGGTHTFFNGLNLSTNASLIGNGDVFASVTNFGIIAPGHSIGTINITGDVKLADSSLLDMELVGSGTNDLLDISGLLQAGGGLKLTLTNGYTGNIGDTFDLFNFGSLSGNFSQTNLPSLSAGSWDTSKLYTQGSIEIVPEPTTWVLLALGFGGLVVRRRCR